jgi:RimJ/RimL family protein N-acetyltransferase
MEADAMADQPIINILGELVALGPLDRTQLPIYQHWMNQFGTLRMLGIPPQAMTLEAETAWFEAATRSTSQMYFTIYERSSWRPIGNLDLRAIDYRDRSAEFGITIGEADCRGKGYGTEATRLTLDYAFTALGLHNVMLAVFAYNPGAIRTYEKAGFREIGRRREAIWMGGRLWDIIYMDCLATEFESPVLAKIFTPDEPRD